MQWPNQKLIHTQWCSSWDGTNLKIYIENSLPDNNYDPQNNTVSVQLTLMVRIISSQNADVLYALHSLKHGQVCNSRYKVKQLPTHGISGDSWHFPQNS